MLRGLVRCAVLLVLGAGMAPAAPAPRAVRGSGGSAVIATVGPTRILRQEFDARANQAIAEYRRRSGSDLPEAMKPVVRRQLLERLIRRNLLVLESKRLGVAPS